MNSKMNLESNIRKVDKSSSPTGQTKRARFDSDPAAQENETMNMWQVEEEIAESMIPIIGKMYRRENVVLTLFNHTLSNLSTLDLIKIHAVTRDHRNRPVKITDTWPIVEALSHRRLKPMRIDVGALSVLVKKAQITGKLISVSDEIGKYITKSEAGAVRENPMDSARDVVLFGFGRIGRLLARLLIEKTGTGSKLRLRAVVVRKKKVPDLYKRANLLMTDSVHGRYKGSVVVDEARNALICNGNTVHLIYADGPDKVDYEAYGIHNAVIVDNTGIWRTEKDLSRHLVSKGASQVVLTAPGKGDMPNLVMGVNSEQYLGTFKGKILSAASCSTNAVVPVIKLIDDKFGIENGHIETIHSFTNDQNLIDNFHVKNRRGRSAVLNMVLTETGAGAATAKALPHLRGKLTASAVRVPTPNVSMAILILNLNREVTVKEINDYIQERAVRGPLMNQVDFSQNVEAVSSDFVGSRAAGIVDGPSTSVIGKRVNIYVWYDNEFGYSCQVVRLLQKWCKIEHPRCPPAFMEAVQSEAEDNE